MEHSKIQLTTKGGGQRTGCMNFELPSLELLAASRKMPRICTKLDQSFCKPAFKMRA